MACDAQLWIPTQAHLLRWLNRSRQGQQQWWKEKSIYSKVKANAAEQEARRTGGSVPVIFALSRCSLKPFGLYSFSSFSASLAPQQAPTVGAWSCMVGLGWCSLWHLRVTGGCSKGKLSTAHTQQQHPKRFLPLFFSRGGSMSRWITATAARGISSFPAFPENQRIRLFKEKCLAKQLFSELHVFILLEKLIQ